MAITFVKDANGKVIVDRDGKKYSLDGTLNVISHPADNEVIIITDTSAPLEQREVLKFGWAEVTTPTASDRNNLVEKLGKNFFYNSATVTFPPGLATEEKQNEIIDELQTREGKILLNNILIELRKTNKLLETLIS